jgi:transcriptional regulator with XRE-family HTH domain
MVAEKEEMHMDKSMGEFIAERRKEKGLTQRELAQMLNITDKAVSKWERNLACPDINTIPKLAEILSVSVEELLNANPAEKPKNQEVEKVIDTVLKAVPLAMGVALITVSILKKDLDLYTISGFMGIGLFAISLQQLRKE